MKNEYHQRLLDDIEAFLAQSGMGASYFGRLATGNSELVKRLRSGCEIKPSTERNVRNFIIGRAARK